MNKKHSLFLALSLATSQLACPQSTENAQAEKTANSADGAEKAAEKKDAPVKKPGDIPAPDDVGAPPADAKKTESGLYYKVVTAGTGKDHPAATDKVKVHYTGWKTDGSMFDSSKKRGMPATFPLNGVIKGWTEGVQLMTEGETARFWIPADLAYGENPGGGRPGGMLVFDIELLEIDRPLPAPEDVAAAPADAIKTKSGLAYKVLQKGDGKEHPAATDKVSVHYTGWTTDGKMFDSSVKRGQAATFPLDAVIKGWTEGVQLMKVGDKVRFWIPGELAYGETPSRPGAPAGTLVFDVELLEIKKPLAAPPDVKAAPKDAKKTASGLAYKVLQKGTGSAHPKETDQVTVHYSGWTTDGKMFDSSVERGQPATFGLNRVIKGWTEGVQLMVEGEKTRFWIPGDLAYGETPSRPGAPAGTLVFDIELLSIKQ